MKCTAHHAEAVAVCAQCGRAVCADCATTSPSGRMTCSEHCAAALTRHEREFANFLQRHVQGARINAVFYLLCGGLSAAGAVGAWFWLPSPFLIWFCAGCGIIFIASGAWQWLAARNQNR